MRNTVPLSTWETNAATTCTVCNASDLNDGSLRARFWMKAATAQTYFTDTSTVKELNFNNIYVKKPSSLVSD